MTKPTDKQMADRRSFLKLAGASVVTTGAAAAGAVTGAQAVEETPGKEKLYRETAHVRRYYDLAR